VLLTSDGKRLKLTDLPPKLAKSGWNKVNVDKNAGGQEMKVKGASYNVNVTVTSVSGSDVLFDMVETVDKNQVANTISDKLTEQAGRKPDSVTCPDNLKGAEGATLRCQLTDGNQKFGVSVTVTDVDAGTVNFNIQVDDQPS